MQGWLLQWRDSLTQEGVGAADPNEPQFVSCAERGLGDPCVDIVFMWAALWPEYGELSDVLMKLVQPNAVLTSVSAWEKKVAMDPMWLSTWARMLRQHPLDAFSFLQWPFSNPQAPQREKEVLRWLAEQVCSRALASRASVHTTSLLPPAVQHAGRGSPPPLPLPLRARCGLLLRDVRLPLSCSPP